MHVDGAIEDVVVAFTDFLDEGFASLHSTFGAGEGDEEIKLHGSEVERLIAQDGGAGVRRWPLRPV